MKILLVICSKEAVFPEVEVGTRKEEEDDRNEVGVGALEAVVAVVYSRHP